MSPLPKIMEAATMILPNPNTLFLDAKKIAPATAPIPEAAIRKPNV